MPEGMFAGGWLEQSMKARPEKVCEGRLGLHKLCGRGRVQGAEAGCDICLLLL